VIGVAVGAGVGGCAPQPAAAPGTDAATTTAAATATATVTANAAGADPARDAVHFDAWRRDGGGAAAHDLAAFADFLATVGVDRVVPLHQLLRTASAWRECGAAPYAVPPRSQWPDVRRVLALVAELRRQGLLDAIEVHSGHRDAALNACAGGARRSAHLVAFAIDFTVPGGPDPAAGLCAFWRREGAAWSMGLSRYPSGRIHVDAMGWRTWGADGTSGTSACATPP
jgi:hypothetical protein